jgi:hypothetical protein
VKTSAVSPRPSSAPSSDSAPLPAAEKAGQGLALGLSSPASIQPARAGSSIAWKALVVTSPPSIPPGPSSRRLVSAWWLRTSLASYSSQRSSIWSSASAAKGAAVSRWRRSDPLTSRVGTMPRRASAAASTSAWRTPAGERTS